MSITELKRQARKDNPDAKAVYPVRAYGVQLWIYLWANIGFLLSCSVLLLHSLVGSFWTIVVNVPLIVLIHGILPWSRWPKPSLHMAAMTSPYVESILKILYPILHWLEGFVGRWIQPDPILLIQSKDELLEILRHNAEEFDHVNPDELKIAENALTFGDKSIGDYMTPLNSVHFINIEDSLTPIVLNELHDSGYSRFPVYQGNNQNIVGTLFLKDALQVKSTKTVREVMRSDIYYVNELQTLDHALKAFIKTKHHIFVVVNEFEDVVGVLSIEDVLEQVIGHHLSDEFDKFEDLRAVAKSTAKQKQKDHKLEHV
jgi:CBS domain containing-hemolysin-like protein